MGFLQERSTQLLRWEVRWIPLFFHQQNQPQLKSTENKENILRQAEQSLDSQAAERTYKSIFQKRPFQPLRTWPGRVLIYQRIEKYHGRCRPQHLGWKQKRRHTSIWQKQAVHRLSELNRQIIPASGEFRCRIRLATRQKGEYMDRDTQQRPHPINPQWQTELPDQIL